MGDREMAQEFLKFAREKLMGQYWPRLRTCVEKLSDEQIWWRPNEASNSIGNLVLHLNGNVGQWLVHSFNRAEDTRNRPAEFAERAGTPVAELLRCLGDTLAQAEAVLLRLTPEELMSTWKIQGFTVTGLAAVFQAVEHFGLHYGQISYITKLVSGEGLGFYRELDTPAKS
jgi:hypothetical protein